MSQLFSPITLGPLTLENRIVIAPMCQYSAVEGQATSWHQIHLGHLALSGASLFIIEATAVEPIGRISPQDLGLWDDVTEEALGNVMQEVRRYSPIRFGIQLGHAGRKASTVKPWENGGQVNQEEGGWQTVAPSALEFQEGDHLPLELDLVGLERVKQAFVESAQRAVRLGFELIELHAAHGYLLHQFLSPLSNQRTDQYGGSLENRMRFPLEVLQAVRQAVPDQIAVGIRLSATDWVDGGWDLEQSIVFCQQAEALGSDFLHVSSGGLSPLQKIEVKEGYQVPFASAIRQKVSIPVMAVGLITDAQYAEAIINNGDADMVALARGLLYNPRWVWHAAAELNAQVTVPPQYLRSEPHGVKGTFKL